LESMNDWQLYKEEVRARTDIAAVIGRYVSLRRQGSQLVGRCPFHDDHSPSLHVTPHPGFYKCFVCGAGGDVFKFLEEHEKIPFREVLEMLGREAGLEPPKSPSRSDSDEDLSRRARAALQWAQAWFHQRLREAPAVLEYATKRGFLPQELSDFQIGFAPEESGTFLQAARAASIGEDALETAGLVSRGDYGLRERFRCRLIFPLCDQGRHPIGFAGRILRRDERAPKYLNSPETVFYHKSRFLYGISHSRTACAKSGEALLVEGYMDWFALWRHGFKNVVAVSGTAFTPDQAKILRAFCKKVVCLFDGDAAGVAATRRSLPILLAEGFEVRFCSLAGTGRKDPDELLHEDGPQAMREALEKAEHWEKWMVYEFAERAERSPEDVGEFLARLQELVGSIPDEIVRRSTWEALEPKLAMAGLRSRDLRPVAAAPRSSGPSRPSAIRRWNSGRERAEAEFLYTLLTHPGIAVDISQDIHPSQLEGILCREILDAILAQAETGNADAAAILEYLEPEALSFAHDLFRLFPLRHDEVTARKFVSQCIADFRTESVRKARAPMLLSARASKEGGRILEEYSALLAQEQHLRETGSQS